MREVQRFDVLLVEDDEADALIVQARLGGHAFHVLRVDRLSDALGVLAASRFDVILLDLTLLDSTGLESALAVLDAAPEVPLVVMTGLEDDTVALEAVRRGAQDYLVKERVDAEALRRSIRYAIERHRLQAGLRQAQKMAAVARLSAALAQEFRERLEEIRGHCRSLSQLPALRGRAVHEVDAIAQTAEEACRLTEQLLAVAGQQEVVPRIMDLGGLLRDMRIALRHLLDPDIELQLDVGDGAGQVEADRGRLQLAILELVLNARDAMPQGGRLCLAADSVDLETPTAVNEAVLPPGRYTRITLTDNGAGIPPEVLPHVFEPFYTTREGRYGLGLAAVYGTIHRFGGTLSIESRPGEATAVRILLPDAGSRE